MLFARSCLARREPVADNDLPDVVAQFAASMAATPAADPLANAPRTAKCFRVPAEEIRENGYDLSVGRYRKVERPINVYESPGVILDRLEALESEILEDLRAIREMVK